MHGGAGEAPAADSIGVWGLAGLWVLAYFVLLLPRRLSLYTRYLACASPRRRSGSERPEGLVVSQVVSGLPPFTVQSLTDMCTLCTAVVYVSNLIINKTHATGIGTPERQRRIRIECRMSGKALSEADAAGSLAARTMREASEPVSHHVHDGLVFR